MRRYLNTDLVIYSFLFFVSLFVSLLSPLAPFAKGIPWTDSSVFIYIAKSIISGSIVYKDVFDHKGPFLYLINLFGIWISDGHGYVGIWLLQLSALLTSAFYLYKTSLLFFNKYISAIIVSMILVFQSCLNMGGNLAEDWAVPFMAVSLNIFAKYFINQKQFSGFNLFVLSTSFVLTFLLRANLVLMWGILGIAVIVDLLLTKRYTCIIKYAILVSVFSIITFTPFLLYFYFNNSVEEFLYGMLWFNFKYTSVLNINDAIFMIIGLCSYVFIIVPIVIFSILSIIRFSKSYFNSLFEISVAFSIVLTIILCCLGRPSMHYLIQIIPLLVFPLGYCCSYIYDNLLFNKLFITSILVLMLTSPIIITSFKTLKKNYFTNNNDVPGDSVVDLIINNTKKDDKILVIGNSTNYYLFSDRMSSSKYPFCYPIIEKDKKIEDEYCEELVKTPPELVVIDFFWKEFDVRIKERIEKILNSYYNHIIIRNINVDIYIRKDSSLVL